MRNDKKKDRQGRTVPRFNDRGQLTGWQLDSYYPTKRSQLLTAPKNEESIERAKADDTKRAEASRERLKRIENERRHGKRSKRESWQMARLSDASDPISIGDQQDALGRRNDLKLEDRTNRACIAASLFFHDENEEARLLWEEHLGITADRKRRAEEEYALWGDPSYDHPRDFMDIITRAEDEHYRHLRAPYDPCVGIRWYWSIWQQYCDDLETRADTEDGSRGSDHGVNDKRSNRERVDDDPEMDPEPSRDFEIEVDIVTSPRGHVIVSRMITEIMIDASTGKEQGRRTMPLTPSVRIKPRRPQRRFGARPDAD